MKNPLLKRVSGTAMAKIGQAGFGLILALVFARVFGADSFGVYAYATATATLVAIFSRFGFHVHIVYAINRAEAEGRSHEVGTILVTAYLATTVLSVIGGLALYGIGSLFPAWEMSDALGYGAALVALTALVQLAGGAMQALGRVVLGTSLEGIIKPVLLLGAVGVNLLFATPQEIGYEGLLNAFVISQTILVIASTALVVFWINKEIGVFTIYPRLAGGHIKESFPFLMTNAMSRLYQDAGLVAVGIAFTPAAVAMFRVAAQVASLIPFGLQALQIVLRPKIARMYVSGATERAKLQRLITRSTRILALVQSPVMIATVLFAPLLMGIFGDEYVAGAMLLTILAIGQCHSILCGLNLDVLSMTGKSAIAAKWSFIALVIVIALMWPLMLLWGSVGAAVAVCVSRIIWNTGLLASAVRHTGLHTSVFGVLPWFSQTKDIDIEGPDAGTARDKGAA
ncbi:O-antigen/teichoic acid export membrane protein [Altererythrobacter atlanticus]|uniref:Polysaccharide biosynthesis protein n=1 Tax=Croceibacterium atlanticum TaxID=1267766 RepID=A0A0F7KP49_9SPHN|nr:oligosaccharide flippase family protein [Croceibacterium atlanticum]AKH41364.1 Polysaccharide biosynthesis protein [Croceibacterium atlanticum]MBB5734121.1 O-antigen/teichoic acid export membrane protein [Croceibacterium atlanticum]